MEKTGTGSGEDHRRVCINDALKDDELRAVLARLWKEEERDLFGLVCRRWLSLQSSERRKLKARAGPEMLRRMAERFSGLLELDLSQFTARSFYPGVTDTDLGVIAAGFRNLQVLCLQNCKGVSDVGMLKLANGLPYLKCIDVSCCRKLTDKGLIAVAQACCGLRRVRLSGCKLVTDNFLLALSRNCRHLEELGLSGCNNITDSGLLSLADGCRHIKVLDISKCSKIGDSGISRISESCFSLNTFKLLDCYCIGDESVRSLASNCKNLETLVIGGCRNVTNQSIDLLAISCGKSLRNLRMDWCSNISDSALTRILLNCKNLVALDIGCCDQVTDVAFDSLERADFELSLKVLKASNCARITVSGIGSVLKYCRHLNYIDIRSCPNITKLGCDQAGLVFPKCCKVNFSGSLVEQDSHLDEFF